MPTYAYKCGECDHEFEIFQTITAKPMRKCPACRRLKLRRMIGSGAGIIFKGSGFYETDYRSDGYKKAARAERPEGAEKPKEEPQKTSTDKGDSKSTTSTTSGSESRATDTAKGKKRTA